MMRTRFVALTGVCASLILSLGVATAATKKTDEGASVSDTPLKKTLAASRKVDQLVEANYAKHKIEANAKVSDELFVRRLYLDIVGRIPTYDEAVTFIDSKDPQKRSKLIDQLLDSEGYVSHNYNYWADLLRVQSRSRYAPMKPYIEFVKGSLRENKPYDQFVRELLSTEGYTWDEGAAGYYLRDSGMPLDNMSNTTQVFLGTQLVCAQCHDHPFDSWTQLQYYQLAAFTYGVDTRDRRNPKLMELREMRRDKGLDREVYRAANRILRPLAYRVNETKRPLRLPHDYAYENAKPKQVIEPATIFGEKVEVKPGDSRKDIYARWLTSSKNPRFTTVIANRLWKRAMGLGLIEPVDDFRSGVDASNPELMSYLVKLMTDLDYDMKQYLRVVYNTQTYQRDVSTQEVTEDEFYHFPGPILRRLSAEQMWDSLLVMTIPDVDERKGATRNYYRYSDGEQLVNKDMKEIMTLAKADAKRRTDQVKYRELTAELQKDYRVASRNGDRAKMNEIRSKMEKIRRQVYGTKSPSAARRNRNNRNRSRDKDPRWAGFSQDLVRASELESPARPGHFLRQFGQSDRETIENANTEATVPQVLTLLNGPMFSQLVGRNSQLTKRLAKATTPEEQLEVIFVSILGRRPSERETKIALPMIEKNGSRGARDVAWALLNGRQFMFVQ